MSKEDQQQTLSNIAGHLQGAQKFIQERAIVCFGKIDQEIADGLQATMGEKKSSDEPYTMTA
jgi:catalase